MLLLLLSLLPAVHTAEPPTILQKSIQGCPSEGYFFERQPQPGIEPAPCYLCLCKSDEQAVCTLRDNERCENSRRDVETTTRRSRRRKHRRRPRRSAGLMELFFQDKKKDQLLKSMKQTNIETCVPKASKSIGCPPKDWCTGCLVCDCNDGGKWECHVMSFCEDKTPRPSSNNIKEVDVENNIPPENKVKRKKTSTKSVLAKKISANSVPAKTISIKSVPEKKISTKSVPAKKTHKRSIIRNKKKLQTSTAPTKKNITIPQKKRFRKISETTTLKPAMPIISVKTKMSFVRKNKSNEVVVIKKYISTMSPIESPELLKYKNDSSKLAQILYQQYESGPKETKNVKREIITHAFTKKKATYGTANSIYTGEKIFNKKPMPKLKLKNNGIGRKPIYVKEHNERNTKIKASKEKREKKSSNNFYDIQKELMESGADNRRKRKQKKTKNIDRRAYYERKEKIKLIALANRRNKRDVSLMVKDSNSTTVINEIVNTTSVNIDQVSETPTELFTNNERIASDLNNYKYAIDNIVTQDYSGSEIVNIDKGEETTLKGVTTVDDREVGSKDVTIVDIVNYTGIEDTTTENPKPASDTLNTLNLVDFNEMITQTEHMNLKNKKTIEANTSIDYNINITELPDSKIEIKGNSEIATTTIVNKFAFELTKTENPHFNNTENYKIIHQFTNNADTSANAIKKVYTKDIEKIITGLNRSKLKKLIKINESTGKNNTFTVNPLSSPIQKHVSKHYKYRSKNRLMAIKYLKKIYSNLLSYNNNNTRFNNNAVMESLCDTFGPCKISSKSVKAINSKITELVTETKKALNIIKAIKRSLQSIEKENNNTRNVTEEVKFKNYVIKLNAILTDNYETPQTEYEMTQIKKIKSNTKVFIHSVSKFAYILNDILKIIRLDKIKFNNLRKHKIILKKVIKPKVDNKLLHKIKNIFKKFNLLQNTFMRKMYQILSDLEKQNNENVHKSRNDQKNDPYKISVKKYMNKINYNLAKLKDVALKMGPRERRKRYASDDDDAIEYLLTLIEYMLRLKNPTNYPPVADGIDLLIDAIKRAPDIKPIRKKVLQEKSTVPNISHVKESSKSSSESGDENVPVSNNETDIINDNSSFEKWYNDTDTLPSNVDNKVLEFRVTTPYVSNKMFTETAKHVDVEDLVFNGNKLQNVYMATYPPYENTEDYFVKEEVTSRRPKKPTPKNKSPAVSESGDETFILLNTTNTKTETIIRKVTENPTKTHFDLLNEEYEKRLKVQIPNDKVIQIKHKKTKRPKNKSKLTAKSDVSSITKETDEENNRKKVIAEEAMLKKHIINIADDDLFKSVGDESVSKDFSSLDANNDITSYLSNAF